jgi:CheY-like chemotaxis protein
MDRRQSRWPSRFSKEQIMSALRKVLVVDDDPVVGKSFNRVLTSKGYTVVTAENATDALEQMRNSEYDLVYTDIRMPGMDGLELAETVKARRPWTPVVIVTGYGTTADEARAKAAGVTAFLHKPLSPEMIEGSAAAALREAAPTSAAAAPVEIAEVGMPAESPVEFPAEAVASDSLLKNIALFFAAPFIGLAYAVFLPFVGIGVVVWFGAKALARTAALRKASSTLKLIGLALGTPLVGLVYVVFLPFAGLALLAWFGTRAALKAAATRRND